MCFPVFPLNQSTCVFRSAKISLPAMSTEVGAASIKEHCYVAIVRSNKEFDAKPYLTGVVTFLGPDNLTYHQLMRAGALNGKFVWTRTMVNTRSKDPKLAPKTPQEGLAFYRDTIDTVLFNHENKHGALDFKLSTLEMLPILSASQFVGHAIALGLMAPDTLTRCKISSSSLGPKLCPVPSADVAASVGSAASTGMAASGGSSAASVADPSVESLAPGSSSLPGAVVTPPASTLPSVSPTSSFGGHASTAGVPVVPFDSPPLPENTSGDSLRLAMQESGLEVEEPAANVEVNTEEGDDFTLARLTEEENARRDTGEEVDYDRLAEDAVLQIRTLPVGEQQHPVIKSLGDTVKRQQVKIKELQDINHSLQQLSAMQDQELKEFQSTSAESIVPGILPAVKKALGSFKKEISQGLEDKLDNILVAVAEQGNSAMANEVASLRACLATTSGKVMETNILCQNAIGAVIMVDRNLASVGLGSRDVNAPHVDIPSVLVGIQNNLKGHKVTPPAPFVSSATVQSIESLKPSHETAGPHFNSGTPSSGSASRKLSGSSASGAPPRKAGRWDCGPSGSASPSLPAVGPTPPSFTCRSLEAEMSASSDPDLYSAMMEAKTVFNPMAKEQNEKKMREAKPVFTPMTKEQIESKTREMRKQLSARDRR